MKKCAHIITVLVMAVSAVSLTYAQDSQQQPGPRPDFSSVDSDNSGDINYEEFSAQTLPHGDAQTIFNEIDADANGVLSEQEFNNHKPPRPPQRQ